MSERETEKNGAARPGPEIVAPAGSPAALRAAVAAGADAVYVGLRHLSARAQAPNFGLADLRRGVEEAHAVGARVYVALNTVVRDDELEVAAGLLRGAQEAGADAAIVQDLGLLALAPVAAPGLALHASTQLVVHSADGVRALAAHGVRRVVVARELSMAAIETLRAAAPDCELEVFVHGALCWSVSGLCLLSSFATGRSGNRGRCAQPCRRSFTAPDGDAGLAFSLTDLWGLRLLPRLAGAGVAAVKIEGRLRSPEYVAAVVRTVRRARDDGPAAAESDPGPASGPRAVLSLFGRRPTVGWLDGPGGADAACVDPVFQGHRGYPVGRVLDGDGGALTVRVSAPFAVGDRLLVDRGDDRPYNLLVASLQVDGESVQTVAPGAVVRLPFASAPVAAGAAVTLVMAGDVKRACGAPDAAPFEAEATAVEADVSSGRLELGAPSVGIRMAFPLPATPRMAPLTEASLRTVLEERGDDGRRLLLVAVRGEEGALRVPQKALRRVRRDFVRAVGLAEDARAAPCPAAARALVAEARKPAGGRPAGGRPAGREEEGGTSSVGQGGHCGSRLPACGEPWTVRVDREEHLTLDVRTLADCIQLVASGVDDRWIPAAAAELVGTAGQVELALPPFVPDGERPALVATVRAAWEAGIRRFQVGSIGGFGLVPAGGRVSTDHTIPVANPLAWRVLSEKYGVATVTLPVEADAALLEALAPTLGEVADVVVYGDVTLMTGVGAPRLAAARPLLGTATARTLADENRVRFRVERAAGARTVVRADRPYALTDVLDRLRAFGCRRFRVDFVGRFYHAGAIAAVLAAARAGTALPGTHRANFDRRWL